jgi:hypothetical protein
VPGTPATTVKQAENSDVLPVESVAVAVITCPADNDPGLNVKETSPVVPSVAGVTTVPR